MKCEACKVSVTGALRCRCGVPFCSAGCMGMHLCTVQLERAIRTCGDVHGRRAS